MLSASISARAHAAVNGKSPLDQRLKPTAPFSDRCPFAYGNAGDARGLGDQVIPGIAAGTDEGTIGLVDAVAEVVQFDYCKLGKHNSADVASRGLRRCRVDRPWQKT